MLCICTSCPFSQTVNFLKLKAIASLSASPASLGAGLPGDELTEGLWLISVALPQMDLPHPFPQLTSSFLSPECLTGPFCLAGGRPWASRDVDCIARAALSCIWGFEGDTPRGILGPGLQPPLLEYVLADHLPFPQTNDHIFPSSLLVFPLVQSLSSHPHSHPASPGFSSRPVSSPGLRLCPGLCSCSTLLCASLWFLFPLFFIFHFPPPTRLFYQCHHDLQCGNMALAGSHITQPRWLFGCPLLSQTSRTNPPRQPDTGQLPPGGLLPARLRKQGRAEDGGHREGPQTFPQLLLGHVSWVWPQDLEQLRSVKARNREGSLKGMVWAAGKRWGSTYDWDPGGF